MIEDMLYPFVGSYMSSPQWIKTSVGKIYSLLPHVVSRGGNSRRFQTEAATRNPDALMQLVETKLSDTLRLAIESIPAYQSFSHLLNRLHAPFDVIRELPILSKSAIKANIDQYVSTKISARHRLFTSTGGSTAIPMNFYLQKGVTRNKEYAYIQEFQRRVGIGSGEVILTLRGRTVPGACKKGGKLWMYDPIKRQLILSCEHMERSYMPEYIKVIRAWHPTYIEAYPSSIYPLARWLKENPDIDVAGRIKGILLYSENVLDHHMSILREVFNCPVLKHYGHSERVLMGASMLDDDRFFFWPQYGHFELIDEAGRTITEAGTIGEIVGTSFDNRVMPFIRYRTGDLATLSDHPHPLLPNFPVIERIEGRRQEFVVCSDERLIAVCGLGAAHTNELSIAESMQFEQFRPGHLIVKIVAGVPISADQRRRIAQRLEEKMQGGCVAEVIVVEAIPRTLRGKHCLMVQHLDITPYLGAPVDL